MEQQQHQQQQAQRLPSHGTRGTFDSADIDQNVAQRYSITTFVPPPSQQELGGHAYSSRMVEASIVPISSVMGPQSSCQEVTDPVLRKAMGPAAFKTFCSQILLYPANNCDHNRRRHDSLSSGRIVFSNLRPLKPPLLL